MRNFANYSQEGVLAREMYMHYGYAVYLSQMFEKQLVALVHGFLAVEKKGDWPYEKLLEEVEKLNKRATLGQLLEKVRTRITLDAAVEAHIQEALKRRNELIHHYFDTYVAQATVTDGQKIIIDDLIESQKIFEQAFFWVDGMNRSLMKKFGVSDEKMAEIIKKIHQEEVAKFRAELPPDKSK